jgi:hypothetical protein
MADQSLRKHALLLYVRCYVVCDHLYHKNAVIMQLMTSLVLHILLIIHHRRLFEYDRRSLTCS